SSRRMRATLARCRLACVAAATGIAATDASSFHRSTGLALLGAAWIAATLLLVDSRRRHDQSSLPVLATAAVDAVLIAVWIGMLPAGGGQYIGLVVLGSAANSVLLKGRRLAFVGALRCAGASTAYWSARGLSTEALRVYLLAIVADTVVSLLVALLATAERHRGRAQMEAARRAAALAADLRRRQAIHEATGAITAESGL